MIQSFPHSCRQQLLSRCNEVLQSQGNSQPLPCTICTALRLMETRSTDYRPWHLRLPDGQAKHALFCKSKGYRSYTSGQEQRLPARSSFLDDDPTNKQLEGQRSLTSSTLDIKGAGHNHTTWWRRDVLHWADHNGVRPCFWS